jgi:YidC/Oxa1 family membrane protein insertase
MQEGGANPQQMLGGCLLMFLQLPIWVALISVFRYAIELRQAPAFFGLISDLTLPDRAFHLGFSLPLNGGEYFNALPVLYVVLTLVQQKLAPKPKDEQARQQQRMMGFMMVFIGFIFYSFSSGLLLYFLTSSIIGIIEQRIIRRELAAEKA